MRTFRRALSALLCAAILLAASSPEAWAQQLQAAAVSAPSGLTAAPLQFAAPLRNPMAGSLGLSASLGAPGALPGVRTLTPLAPPSPIGKLGTAGQGRAPYPAAGQVLPSMFSTVVAEGRAAAVVAVQPLSAPRVGAAMPQGSQPAVAAKQSLEAAGRIAERAARPEYRENAASWFSGFFHGTEKSLGSSVDPAVVETGEARSNGLSRGAQAFGRSASDVPAPRRSLGRALTYGYFMSVLGLGLIYGAQALAQALGYVVRSNYQGPAIAGMGVAGLFAAVAVIAPIVEEIMFRAGFMGLLKRVGTKVLPERWAAVAAGVLSSVVFVLLHETADPLLIGLRFADALTISWTHEREGLAAAMAQHAVHNGLIGLGLLAQHLFPGGGALIVVAALAAANLAGLIAAGASLYRQRAQRREGRIARHRLTSTQAFVLAGLLAAAALASPDMGKIAFYFALGLAGYGFILRQPDADKIQDDLRKSLPF